MDAIWDVTLSRKHREELDRTRKKNLPEKSMGKKEHLEDTLRNRALAKTLETDSPGLRV